MAQSGVQREQGEIRVAILQPSLARYRVPVFRELAGRPGIMLNVLYATIPGIPNVQPDGFAADFTTMWRRRLFGHPIYWHGAQWEWARRSRTDVLILPWDLHYISLVLALVRARALGVRTILWGHGYSKAEAKWRAWTRQKVARLATVLLFYNRSTARRYIAEGFDADRVFVAINSIDQAPIRHARTHWLARPDELAKFRREQALDGRPTVLFVSRFDPDNRLDLLLSAAARLSARFPTLQLVLVGNGEPEASRLRAMASRLGIADRVKFTGAIYDEHSLAPWFLSADLFCYPANIGLSVLHAFGYGVPVVTSDKTEAQNPEIEAMRDGTNGLTYRDGDVEDLAEVLARALNDPDLRARLSAGALATISDDFTVLRMVEGMEQAIRRAVDHPAPAGRGAAATGQLRDARPGVAIIANSQTPYRLHVHQRIVRELPQIKPWSVFTHEKSFGADWHFIAPAEINPISFGQGESSDRQEHLRYALSEWRKGKRVINWIKQQGIRAVLCSGYNDFGRVRLIRWCARHGIPCFIVGDSNIRSDLARGLKAWVKLRLVGYLVRKATGVLPCGTLGRAYFEKYGASPDRVFYFPYEPDYDLIRGLPASHVADVASRFALRPKRRRIVFSGRLTAVKRPDLILDAFVTIADERPDWDLVMMGDGPLSERMQDRVPSALRARVIWTGFVSDQSDVSAIYRASDVLVLPSDFDPWAVVINEAACAGLAIVSSDVVGAAAELVRDGVNGRTFRAGDLAGLVTALRDVTDPQRIDALKAGSPQVLEEWRRRGDPVEGLRRALAVAGIQT